MTSSPHSFQSFVCVQGEPGNDAMHSSAGLKYSRWPGMYLATLCELVIDTWLCWQTGMADSLACSWPLVKIGLGIYVVALAGLSDGMIYIFDLLCAPMLVTHSVFLVSIPIMQVEIRPAAVTYAGNNVNLRCKVSLFRRGHSI